jgi:hypothetical protein
MKKCNLNKYRYIDREKLKENEVNDESLSKGKVKISFHKMPFSFPTWN